MCRVSQWRWHYTNDLGLQEGADISCETDWYLVKAMPSFPASWPHERVLSPRASFHFPTILAVYYLASCNLHHITYIFRSKACPGRKTMLSFAAKLLFHSFAEGFWLSWLKWYQTSHSSTGTETAGQHPALPSNTPRLSGFSSLFPPRWKCFPGKKRAWRVNVWGMQDLDKRFRQLVTQRSFMCTPIFLRLDTTSA